MYLQIIIVWNTTKIPLLYFSIYLKCKIASIHFHTLLTVSTLKLSTQLCLILIENNNLKLNFNRFFILYKTI